MSKIISNRKVENFKDIEFSNMLLIARAVVKSALYRTESRGAHFRIDFPEKDDQNWKKTITISNNEEAGGL